MAHKARAPIGVLDGNRDSHRFRVKVLFGLFEADATGSAAIGAAVLLFVLMGVGRLWRLW